MDPYLYLFDGAKIMLLIELSKSISNYLQTQGFAGAPIFLLYLVPVSRGTMIYVFGLYFLIGGLFLGIIYLGGDQLGIQRCVSWQLRLQQLVSGL